MTSVSSQSEQTTQSHEVPIVMASDDNYAAHLAVAITSVLENGNRTNLYHFHILDGGLKKTSQDKLQQLTATYPYCRITFHSFQKSLPDVITTYLPIATFYRLLLPTLLAGYDKVLYLDTDTVVLGDISKLFYEDLHDAYIAAVPDLYVNQFIMNGATNYLQNTPYKNLSWKEYARDILNLDPTAPAYFNAGVAVLNLALIRQDGLTEKLLDFLKQFQPLALCDQDVLNAVLGKKKKMLDLSWNLKADVIRPLKCPPEVRIAMKHPQIIHYRLWAYGTAFSEQYWKYLALTPFAGQVKKRLFSYKIIYQPFLFLNTLRKLLMA